MSTNSNNCIRAATSSQKHGIVFVTQSTLSTAINTCQHPSTEALASNNSRKGNYPWVVWLWKQHQQCQQTATMATEVQYLTETWLCFCDNINTVNSHQHMSTLVNKDFSQQYFWEGTLSLSLGSSENHVNNVNRQHQLQQSCQKITETFLVVVTMSILSIAVNTCQHLSTEALTLKELWGGGIFPQLN